MNTGVVSWPDPYSAGVAVRSMQTKLHLWAARDAGRRFGDLFNLVYDPAFLVVAWERVSTNKGAASPVLSNVYLDRLDRYVGQRLLPEYNSGRRRRPNRAYQVLEYAIQRARRHGDRAEARRLTLRRRQLPSQDPADPGYRRLRYVRYCDDWLLGFAGPKREAEEIKSKIAAFLRDELKLELSQSKTLITHATSQAAHFLGYEIRAQHSDTKITRQRRRSTEQSGCSCPRPSSGSGARST